LHLFDWRHYRQHLILSKRKRFFGRPRFLGCDAALIASSEGAND
jgi:hypothetical protein